MSNSIWVEVIGSAFSLVVGVVICVCVHLLFRSYGFTEVYLHPGVMKTLLVLGLSVIWQIYHIWKKYKAEQSAV